MLMSSLASGRSVVPSRVVTPPLDLFSRSNKILPDGKVEVRVTTFSKKGKFRKNGSRLILSEESFQAFKDTASAVVEMIPDKNSNDEGRYRRGTAFSIGENLVLTNNHVLDESFHNTSHCADFEIQTADREKFDCKKVHYCSPAHDICLIEMETKIKTKRDCFFCRGTKYEVSLALGPALKLNAKYHPDPEIQDREVLTAIGNSAGYGIHLSQGRGVRLISNRVYFYAPITNGNSGGALLDKDNLVIGVVRAQSINLIDTDPNKAFNVATPVSLVVELIRKALRDDPETLEKFNKAVVE